MIHKFPESSGSLIKQMKHTSILTLNQMCFLYVFIIFPNSIDAKPLKSAVSAENKSGFHVQIINFISKEVGQEVNIHDVPLARRLQMISTGKLDLLVGLRKTPERESRFIYIEPSYTKGYPVSAFYINSHLIENKFDSNKKMLIAVTKHSAYIKDYNLSFHFELIEVPSLYQQIQMLDKGRVDAFIHGKKKATIALNKMQLSHIKPSSEIKPDKLKKVPSYIVISKFSTLVNDIDKLSRISKILRRGKYRELHDLYYQNKSKAN